MNMVAAGIYIRTLREAQKLSRAEVAHRSGTHESQIVRIEAGEQDTRGSLLIAIVRTIGGNLNELADLMLNEDISPEEARTIAQHSLSQQPESYPAIQSERLQALIQVLEADPRKYYQLLGYAKRLSEE